MCIRDSGDSKFDAAKTGSDGALIFNAYQKTDAEDMVTSIEGANAAGVSIEMCIRASYTPY